MLAVLGEAAVRTLLLAGAVQGTLWLLRVRTAQLLLSAWTAVLLASVAMPVLPHVFPMHVALDTTFSRPLIEGVAVLLPGPLLAGAPESAGGQAEASSVPVSWLATLYFAVCGTLLVRVVLGVALAFRLLCRAVPVFPDWGRGARLRISRDVAGPVTVANVVLLPADAALWPAETRLAVLAHERAHVARWDFAMLVASQLNRALFWFSPMPWWLHRRLVALSELASDDQAMAASQDRIRYAEILLEMGRRCTASVRGPAMARPATLGLRIDRILLDQVPVRPVERPRQVLLALGVGGLSMLAASLAPRPVPQPLLDGLPSPWNAGSGPVLRQAETGGVAEPMAEVPPGPLQDAAVRPSTRGSANAAAEPGRNLVAASATRVAPASTAPLPSARVSQQSDRQTPRTAAKVPPAQPPLRVLPQPVVMGGDRRTGAQGQGSARAGKAVPQLSDVVEPAETPIAPADVIQRPFVQQIAYATPHPTVPPDFQGFLGSLCTGTVVVGLRAQSSSDRPPYVVGGQAVAARAHFFAKPNGTPWVRFDAFGRPPLDLPVRFTRYGMTWTGEYGIAYTVRAADGDRLAGLAALVRGDSAMLDFSCVKSALHLL